MSKQTEKDAKHIEELNALLVELGYPGKWSVIPGLGRRSKEWRWVVEDGYWYSCAGDADYLLRRLRNGDLVYDERQFHHLGDRGWCGHTLADHNEKVAKRQASKQKQGAKDARLAELEAWYAEYQQNNVSTRLEVEMAFPKLTDFTRDEIETAIQQNDFESILLKGSIESRRIFNEVLHAKLEEQLAQQDRPAQVEQVEVAPKTYITLDALMTPNGMRKVADALVKVAYQVESLTTQVASKHGVIEVLKANIAELEAQVAAQSCACHFCQGHGDECICGCGADDTNQPEVEDDNEPHGTDFVPWEQRKQKHLEAVERQKAKVQAAVTALGIEGTVTVKFRPVPNTPVVAPR